MPRYDIRIDATTTDGITLRSVHLPHAPDDADKIARIRESLMRGERFTRPVVLADAGDHHIALSGVHRLCAAQGIDGVIDAVILPDLGADAWELIDDAHDDEDMLEALIQIGSDRDDMDDVIAAIRGEIEAAR